jgi:hypothetical protein
MNKKDMDILGTTLVECTINALENNPSPGWAGVARGLLSDWREVEGSLLPAQQMKELKDKISKDAPFKFGTDT